MSVKQRYCLYVQPIKLSLVCVQIIYSFCFVELFVSILTFS